MIFHFVNICIVTLILSWAETSKFADQTYLRGLNTSLLLCSVLFTRFLHITPTTSALFVNTVAATVN